MNKTSVLDTLKKAAKGLLFESETESPLEPFLWKNGTTLDAKRLLKLAGARPNTPVEETTLDNFFRVVPSEDRPAFQNLTKVLQDQLSDIKVYKVGEDAEKQAYIVGKTKDGQWAGLKTTVVET
jgi:hypothetical protein